VRDRTLVPVIVNYLLQTIKITITISKRVERRGILVLVAEVRCEDQWWTNGGEGTRDVELLLPPVLLAVALVADSYQT
jgi:hypothetical protein